MFDLIYIFGTLFLMSTCYSFSIYIVAIRILNVTPTRKSSLLYCTIFYGIQVIANLLLMQGFEQDDAFMVNWNIYLYTLHVVILIFVLLWTYRTNTIRTIAAAALGHFVVFTIGSLAEEVLLYYVPNTGNFYLYSLLVAVLPHVLMMIFSLLISLLLQRLEFDRYFEALFRNRIRAFVTLLFSLLLMHIHTIIRLLFPVEKVSMITASYSIALIAAALFFLLYTARYHESRERVKAQEDIILQQQAHLALLGELQQEMRAFRHDFANLMAGITQQAQDGDLKGIQDFMHNTSHYFDERLGDEIKNLEAVNKIFLPSLRSLITSKISLMKKKGIHPNIEILYPVKSQGMGQHDLLRVLGILLDNAIEEATKSKFPHISLVLLQTETALFVAVANSYGEAPDLTLMSRDSYTTKGMSHGTGLMSLRKIIRKYPTCVTGMKLRDEMFHYEINIPLHDY